MPGSSESMRQAMSCTLRRAIDPLEPSARDNARGHRFEFRRVSLGSCCCGRADTNGQPQSHTSMKLAQKSAPAMVAAVTRIGLWDVIMICTKARNNPMVGPALGKQHLFPHRNPVVIRERHYGYIKSR